MLLPLVCACTRKTPSEADVLAIYEAFFYEDYDPPDRVLLQDVTIPVTAATLGKGPPSDEWRRFSPEVRQALEDLVARSGTSRRLPDLLRVRYDDVRISADSAQAILQNPGPDGEGLQRLPGRASVVLLSTVGLSRDGTVAVVYEEDVCGATCGGATARVVRKHPGGWVAAERLFSVIY